MNVFKEISKDGINHVLYIEQISDGKKNKKYIQSKYNPISEAKIWANENYKPEKNIYIIFGGGLLYHVLELINQLEDKSKIIVIEPSKEIYSMAKNDQNFKKLIKDPRVHFIATNSNFDVLNYLKLVIKNSNFNNIQICKLQSYETIFHNEYREFVRALNKYVIHKKINENTSNIFSIDYTKNIVNNLFIIQKSHYIMKFRDKFKGKVAIIVSAGPSLTKNIELIKGNEDKFIIISGGRTLKTLLDIGITPHFVVSIDPSDANYELFKPVLNSKVPLVSSLVNNKKILKNYEGEKIFYNDFIVPGLDIQMLKQNIDGISGGGSVATYQTTFANYIGCNKIILIGQDLAFTDNKFHAEIASNNDNSVKDDRGLIRVKGIKQEYIYTSYSLNMYKDWFENYAYLEKNIDIINCTEGGAFIEGLKHMDLSEAILKFSDNRENYYEQIDNILSNSNDNISYEEFYNNIKDMLESTNKIIELSEEAIMLSKKLQKKDNSENILRKFNRIDKIIKEHTTNTMAAALLIKNELLMFEEINLEKKEDIINANLRFYKIVNDTYKNFKEIIEDALELYEN